MRAVIFLTISALMLALKVEAANLIYTNKYPSSGIVLRDSFVYLPNVSTYADLNGATITVENCWALGPDTIRNGTVLQPIYERGQKEKR